LLCLETALLQFQGNQIGSPIERGALAEVRSVFCD